MKLWRRKIRRSAFWYTGTHIPEEMPASALRKSEDGSDMSLETLLLLQENIKLYGYESISRQCPRI